MNDKIKALAFIAALYALTYLIEWHPAETRAFMLHVVIVLVLEMVVSTIRFSRPVNKGDKG